MSERFYTIRFCWPTEPLFSMACDSPGRPTRLRVGPWRLGINHCETQGPIKQRIVLRSRNLSPEENRSGSLFDRTKLADIFHHIGRDCWDSHNKRERQTIHHVDKIGLWRPANNTRQLVSNRRRSCPEESCSAVWLVSLGLGAASDPSVPPTEPQLCPTGPQTNLRSSSCLTANISMTAWWTASPEMNKIGYSVTQTPKLLSSRFFGIQFVIC